MKIKYILTSFIATMLIIYGCQKQNTDVVEPLNNTKNLTKTTKKILIFKDKMEKAKQGFYNEKSGDGMVGIDSAEWYLEAAINYTYDLANEGNAKITWRSKTTTITLNNDEEVDLLQLAEAYDLLITDMVGEGEYLFIADISTKDDGNKAGSIEVLLTTGTAQASAPPPPPGNINFDSYWHWNGDWKYLDDGEVWNPFVGSGYCDPPNNQIINNKAASDILQTHNSPSIAIQPGQYWVDVTDFLIHPADPEYHESNEIWFEFDNDYLLENTGGGEFEWLIYKNETTNDDPCMSPTEMDFYINHGVQILAERLRPENSVFSGIITSPDAVWGPPGFDNILAHKMRLFYGRIVTEGTGQ